MRIYIYYVLSLGLGHIYYINGEYGDWNNYLFHNGFNATAILNDWGISYIGIEQLPPFITRAILLDVAGYIGQDPLPNTFAIDTDVIEEVFQYQGLSVDDIEVGDVILIYTGWLNAYYDDDDFYYTQEPGLTLDTVINIFGPKKVLLLGADNWSIELVLENALNGLMHIHWIVCHGGFLYENLNLIEWVTDARNGSSPWMGGFYWSAVPIEGGVGGLGTPMVIV